MKKISILVALVACAAAGADDAGLLAQEFIAPPVEGHVHASTLLPLADGGYLAAWFEGSKEGAADVAIKGSRRRNGQWGPVRVLAKVNPDSPHWNPVLWKADDGRIVLFFKVGRNCSDWRTYVRESRDEGETWTPPRELVPGEVRGGRGPVRNKCLRLANGRWLAPASREIGRWRAFVDISDDDGRTWRASPEFPVPADAPAKFGVIQPTLWSDAAGVHALLRANDGWIWRTDSTDNGETWRELRRSRLRARVKRPSLPRLERRGSQGEERVMGFAQPPRAPFVVRRRRDLADMPRAGRRRAAPARRAGHGVLLSGHPRTASRRAGRHLHVEPPPDPVRRASLSVKCFDHLLTFL